MLKLIFAASLIVLVYRLTNLNHQRGRAQEDEEKARQAHMRDLYPDRNESPK